MHRIEGWGALPGAPGPSNRDGTGHRRAEMPSSFHRAGWRATALWLLWLVAVPIAWGEEASVRPFTAVYAISTAGMDLGEARRVLRAAGSGQFVFQSLSHANGLVGHLFPDRILESSRWEYAGGRVRPLEYSYRREGGSRQRSIGVVFDWGAHLAHVTTDHAASEVALPDGTMDPLVFQIALMQDLAKGGKDFSYPVVDARKHSIRTYHIRVVATGQVTTPSGAYEALELRRLDESSKRQFTLWCAPTLGYLPVRIDYTEKDGRVYRSLLKSLEPAAARTSTGQ